jgi:hypothetical protein
MKKAAELSTDKAKKDKTTKFTQIYYSSEMPVEK